MDRRLGDKGFTLLEIVLVMVVFGLIFGMGISVWMGILESKKVGVTRSILHTAENCLVNYVLQSHTVPPAAEGYTRWCLVKDAWGNRVKFENVADGEPVHARMSTKELRDREGVHPGVVMVLVSMGPDGRQDYSITEEYFDFRKGDDIHLYVTASELNLMLL